ncbi:autotransporter domain-containing protein [Phyllobacterium zundukense]|uniref:Autotransporter domain-containing protein n=1 Tax=Phyllobacterium zundukense TaxID=1867719 RepID=A0A2N9W0R5_9HYPH|nr:autotransporter domain-containing protein [Phyllobacterium zundukense]ATU90398.1 hypothetical protein BLM14_01005 [Phyllobacterium zundukense]PIO45333.1 hypothetical protein B5P45_07620 [Phyllobacterium zundukense]
MRLTGQNTYTGDTIINGGLLAVDGSITSKAIINDSGILGGIGSVGSLVANTGGRVSPGNSVGKLTVTGDATFEKGSIFDVEIAADAGAADQLDVTGKVALLGGAVQARIEGETAFFTKDQVVGLFTRSYDILLAGKGIEGTFETVRPQYNYISAVLDYSHKNKVTLGFMLTPDPVLVVDPEIGAPVGAVVDEFVFEPELESVVEDAERAGLARTEAERLKLEALRERVRTLVLVDAKTKNQKNAGDAIKQMDIGDPLLNTVLFSQVGQVLPYDNLTGEVHATLDGVLIEDSHFISTAATDRIRAAFDGVAAKAQPVIAPLAYGAPVKAKGSESFGTFDLAGGSTGSVPAPAATALWGEAYGAFARGISDGNASRYSRSTGGFVTGLDGVVAETWRFGLLAGYGSSSLNGNGRALVDSYQIGLYGGTTWDSLGLRFGANLGHHEIETKRIAIFGGLANEHEASYDAKTVQVFGEIGYEIKTAYAELEPFAGVSHVHLKTDAFEETGDISNLSGEASTTDLTTTTLGLRVSRDFALSESVNVTARGTLGWRHAYGDVTPQQRLAFAGDQAFSVEGLPVAQDTGFVEAGLDLGIGRNTTLGISYSGQFSKSASDNAVKADLTVRF